MGMFDYVKCHHSLLSPDLRDVEYQTKDLDCGLDTYTIAEDGCLWQQPWYGEEHENEPRQLFALYPYTGQILFYGNKDEEEWLEFRATFHAGRLTELEQTFRGTWKERYGRHDAGKV